MLLHRRDRPARGEHENPLCATVVECVTLGDRVALSVDVDADPAQPLAFSLPLHVARRNRIGTGALIGLSLLAEHLHLMPAQPD